MAFKENVINTVHTAHYTVCAEDLTLMENDMSFSGTGKWGIQGECMATERRW